MSVVFVICPKFAVLANWLGKSKIALLNTLKDSAWNSRASRVAQCSHRKVLGQCHILSVLQRTAEDAPRLITDHSSTSSADRKALISGSELRCRSRKLRTRSKQRPCRSTQRIQILNFPSRRSCLEGNQNSWSFPVIKPNPDVPVSDVDPIDCVIVPTEPFWYVVIPARAQPPKTKFNCLLRLWKIPDVVTTRRCGISCADDPLFSANEYWFPSCELPPDAVLSLAGKLSRLFA